MAEPRMSNINDLWLPNNFNNVQREVDSGLIWLSIVLSNQINVLHHFYMSD